MENKDRNVRSAIINTMLGLLKKKPISKISIGEVSEISGISRKTIYNYFTDKYDIRSAAFDEAYCDAHEQYIKDHDYEMLIRNTTHIFFERKGMYKHIYASIDEQNSFLEQFAQRTFDVVLGSINHKLINSELTTALYYHVYGVFFLERDIIMGKLEMDEEELIDNIMKCIPDVMKKALHM